MSAFLFSADQRATRSYICKFSIQHFFKVLSLSLSLFLYYPSTVCNWLQFAVGQRVKLHLFWLLALVGQSCQKIKGCKLAQFMMPSAILWCFPWSASGWVYKKQPEHSVAPWGSSLAHNNLLIVRWSQNLPRVVPFGSFLVGMEFRVAHTLLWPMGITPLICVGVVVCIFIEFFMGFYSICKSSAWIYLTKCMLLRTRHTQTHCQYCVKWDESELTWCSLMIQVLLTVHGCGFKPTSWSRFLD